MAAFEFEALDTNGRQQKGVLEADTARQIRRQLRDKGLTPLNVDAVIRKQKSQSSFSFSSRRSLSSTDLSLVTRQLATLVQASLPIEESLKAVTEQCEKDWIKSMMLAVRARVVEGHTLANSLREFPASFDHLYCSMVAAGEKSGFLASVLQRLADYTEKRQYLTNKVTVALIYPAFLVIVALAVVSFLLSYVVPMVVEQFMTMNAELPVLTIIIIALSEFIQNWGLLLLIGIVLLVFIIKVLLRSESRRTRWHEIMLKLPLVGKVARGLNSARFARTLSIMVASGVPLLEGLKIAGEVMTNLVMKNAVFEAAILVSEGASLHKSLAETGYFPAMMLHMIASGENSGELEQMLERTADHQDQDFETLVTISLGLFEPLMILFMGILVLLIVLAILLPIFQLNQLVG
ncbi:MAG: type II secretion system inner membrane protein GspF [Gammaproteobacteria bacterium]|nr:type II secretion system inner membrane protein GspF [Gammaproteobacteria bacterium]